MGPLIIRYNGVRWASDTKRLSRHQSSKEGSVPGRWSIDNWQKKPRGRWPFLPESCGLPMTSTTLHAYEGPPPSSALSQLVGLDVIPEIQLGRWAGKASPLSSEKLLLSRVQALINVTIIASPKTRRVIPRFCGAKNYKSPPLNAAPRTARATLPPLRGLHTATDHSAVIAAGEATTPPHARFTTRQRAPERGQSPSHYLIAERH
ncbi:hypothetical protein C8F04DRAFT_582338 [Mycena alexandri]|uniref:Uncharacterized protein n=1 Tax=Mycena alexandri TaxID=1745969 RepID=A0AAD6X3D6_9AGAR|nr:hypothetical protein C8F04DRAFT_582338 [Mycena alexandri]